jgi:hypothetical protein
LSHSKLRAEKICLNCGSPTPERYCPVCGQENIQSRQSVWHLVNHFFSDITHFDGKFFVTVKDLFRKPGFLSKEYMEGRRVTFLDPIRMYIFTSAFFFIIFFSMVDVASIHLGTGAENAHIGTDSERQKQIEMAEDQALSGAEDAKDSASIRRAFAFTGVEKRNRMSDSLKQSGRIMLMGNVEDYHSVEQYDSAQRALPAGKRDSWMKSILKRKGIEMSEKYKQDKVALIKAWINIFMHNFPKLLFLSLPLFALLLKLLYVRRKKFYYVDHGIFAVHLYIFSFLILLVYIVLKKIQTLSGWHWINWIEIIVLLFPFWYYYKAMRNFYGQSRGKTILKYFLLFCSSFLVQIFLLVIFFFFSILEL